MLTDIEIDVNGDLILGFADRFGHQGTQFQFLPAGGNENVVASGDLLRAANNGDGTYTIETNGTVGATNGAGAGNNDGPGGGEYYLDDAPVNVHDEPIVGGLAILLGANELGATAYDPTNNVATGGVLYFDNLTGRQTRGYEVYERDDTDYAGKSNGITDLEYGCEKLPIQIGNYAWVDQNADGIQQACEPPLEDVTVKLYRKPSAGGDPIQIASTMTDVNGNYYFSSTSATDPDLNWTGTDGDTIVSADSTYFIAFCGDAGFDDTENTIQVNGTTYCLSPADTGEGTNPDLNDSDATAQALGSLGTFPAYCTVAGETDTTNHTFDVGFKPVAGLSLGSTVFLDNNNDGLQNGADMGIAMVEVQLFDVATGMQVLTDANGMLVTDPADAATVVTDADGNYLFSNLPEGDYYVVLPSAPASAPLSSNETSSGFMETDPDDNTDNDDEGLQPGGAGTAVSSDTITLTAEMEPLNEPAQGGGQDTISALGLIDENGNMTLDFGFFATVSLGDTAFVDLDGDGLQTMGEPGIAGVTVVLLDSNGDTVMVDADGMMITGVTMTAADGSYLFDNLPPGSYSVAFDISTADDAEFYDFTMANAGNDLDDSDNSISLSDSTAQSDPTAFLNSGEEDLTLDVGVICAVEVAVAEPFSVCSTQPIDLTEDVIISPDTSMTFGATWSTPDGTGTFMDVTGASLTAPFRFGTALSYQPSSADAQRGQVTMVLTTDDPSGPCAPVSNQVIVTVLRVDCGEFFWGGQ